MKHIIKVNSHGVYEKLELERPSVTLDDLHVHYDEMIDMTLTRWYNGEELIKELDVVGELGYSLIEKKCTRCEIGTHVTSIGDNAFSNCSNLTSVTIPNSVTSIGSYAFWICRSLTSVTIPNGVTSIGNNVFNSCSSLTSLTIPNSVTSIGNGAFHYCSSLTSVTIPNGVTTIGIQTFFGCNSLTSVTYNGTIEQWNAINKGYVWKSGVPSTCVVHCTDGDISI